MLQAQDLSADYSAHAGRKERPAISGLSFTASPGGLTGILGPNGSGKTTLLKCLAGLLPLQQGRVLWNDAEITAASARRRARLMSFVPQSKDAELPDLSAFDFTLMGRYAKSPFFSSYSRNDKHKTRAALEITDCAHLTDRNINAVSGGELQRIYLARALAQETPILLLDEPSSSLDPGHASHIFQILTRLAYAQNLIVVTALHDINLASIFCARLLLLKDGRQIAQGPTQEILTHQNLDALYSHTFTLTSHPRHGVVQALP